MTPLRGRAAHKTVERVRKLQRESEKQRDNSIRRESKIIRLGIIIIIPRPITARVRFYMRTCAMQVSAAVVILCKYCFPSEPAGTIIYNSRTRRIYMYL